MRTNLSPDWSDRRYMLDRMGLAILDLADGYPHSAGTVLEEVYEVLRTQGINRDKTVAAVVIGEGVRFWKGEPFEQAMAMFYYSVQQAVLGTWDNARAAAGSSLFTLRDFGQDGAGERLDTYAIARRALEYEQALARGDDLKQPLEKKDYLDHGYAVRESDFVLGYLMNALANQQLGRDEEASDDFLRAEQIDPNLGSLIGLLREGHDDTILVVSYGLGPQKVAYGPDGALARFRPRTPTDNRPLLVRINGRDAVAWPIVCDLNRIASSHMWNNLEEVRLAKSTLGNALLIGGSAATGYGLRSDKDTATLAGIGLLATGLLAKGGARADTRYCEVMPQRLYVASVQIDHDDTTIEVQVKDDSVSRLVLAGLSPSGGPGAQLCYVRLLWGGAAAGFKKAPSWATSGRIHYANDQTVREPVNTLPYILGGRCVRMPGPAAMRDYQRQGFLEGLTYNDLRELYRAEDIALAIDDQSGQAGLHLLEGGRSLVAPMAGTVGFARLFGQVHPEYRPSSPQVIDWFERSESTWRDVRLGGGESGGSAG